MDVVNKGENYPPFKKLIWLMPISYIPHIAEEYYGGFTTFIHTGFGGPVMAKSAFIANNTVFMLILTGLCTWAYRTRSRRAAFALLAWASANLFWDFLLHIFGTAFSGLYFGGVVTASLFYYPISFFVAASALREHQITPAALAAACGVGFSILSFLVWGGLYHFHM